MMSVPCKKISSKVESLSRESKLKEANRSEIIKEMMGGKSQNNGNLNKEEESRSENLTTE